MTCCCVDELPTRMGCINLFSPKTTANTIFSGNIETTVYKQENTDVKAIRSKIPFIVVEKTKSDDETISDVVTVKKISFSADQN
jgi:hypothetical protein